MTGGAGAPRPPGRRWVRGLRRGVAAAGIACGAFLAWLLLLAVERPPGHGGPGPVDTAVADPGHGGAVETSRRLVAAVQARKGYPSLSAAVAHDGQLVWRESRGYAAVAAGTPAGVDTRYPIGSISKPLTATVAMRLVERGGLALDAPIVTYLPRLPPHYRGVTMRQLLSHQAGVRHYALALIPPFFNESGRNMDYPSVESGLAIFLDDPPLFAPDASFHYSTYGYSLASRVLEAAAGASFLDLVDRELLDPLGLADTTADRGGPASNRRARDYRALPARLGVVPAPATNSSYKWAGGGFVSTPADLVRFANEFMAGRVVSARLVAEMTTARRLAGGQENPQGYGLGWRSGRMSWPQGSASSVPIVHHGGTASGAECMLLLVPTRSLATALCGNAYTGGSGDLLQLAADVSRAFLAIEPAAR